MDNLYWMEGTNFGDAMNPYLYEKIVGRKPKRVVAKYRASHYMGIGSVLNNGNEHTVAWGTGLAWNRDVVHPKVDIRAVRGPLTREIAIRNGCSCPEVYGDPALLLPRYYNPIIEKKYKLGIIPHVIDHHLINPLEGSMIINLNDSTEKVVRDLLECEKVVSSSLHGIIVADAYGIPAKWVEFSNRVLGDKTKFYDYFDSVQVPRYDPVDFRKSRDMSLISIPEYDITIDLDKLMDACPFI